MQLLHRRSMTAALAAAAMAAGLAALPPGPAEAVGPTTYYVDSASGSDANAGTSTAAPWQSLAKVNATTLQPGDQVLFKGGSTWTGSLTVSASGTAALPITIGAYGTGWPVINGNRTALNTVSVINASYVHVQGLEVTNSTSLTTSSSTYYRGIYFSAQDIGQVSGDVISGNWVHDVDGKGGSGGIGAGGIAAGVRGNTTPTWYDGLRITGNEVDNVNAYGISTFTTWCAGCQIYTAETGIPSTEVSSTRKATTGLEIDHNYVHDVTGGGITPQYADGAHVDWNTVDRAASHQLVAGGGNVGIWWQGTDGILVDHNTVQHTAAEGIYSDADGLAFDADMGTTHSTVQDNISIGNNGGFFMCLISAYNNQVRYNVSVGDKRMVFRLLSGCGNTRAYDNTIWSTTDLTPTLTAPGQPGTPQPMQGITVASSSSHTVADNIIYNPEHAPYVVSGQPVTDYSHNLYWDGGTGTTTAANDSAAVTGDPQVSNSAVTLPADGLITPAQFNAYFAGFTPGSSSPARNKGVSEWGQTSDALGTTVPVGAVDLGAIQHAVTASASTSLGTSLGAVSNVADGNPATSWASANSPVLPGDLTVAYSDARTFDAVTIAAAFGQGQGPTGVTVQTWNGSAWVTQVTNAPVSWHQNTATVEYGRIQLPSAVTTTQLRVLINSANLTWGHVAVYEISASYQGVAASSMGELSASTNTAALVDNDPATSWASPSSTLGYLEVDGPPVTATSITLSAAFGQGQGPTSVLVQALNGDTGAWTQVVPTTAITWSSNTSTVESRTLTFAAPTTATRFEVQIKAANNTWGHVALNGISVQ